MNKVELFLLVLVTVEHRSTESNLLEIFCNFRKADISFTAEKLVLFRSMKHLLRRCKTKSSATRENNWLQFAVVPCAYHKKSP